MRIAVIDLGTNTCNLLIAERQGHNFHILHQSKELVRLGDNRIRKNEISPNATQRVIHALTLIQNRIEQHRVDQVKLFATSAVRSANNKQQLSSQIREKTGWFTEIIDGEREAELIFKGVLLALGELQTPGIILDIGGGSNELIIASGREKLMAESQPTGMARIIHQFDVSDPIVPEEVETLKGHFRTAHIKALEAAKARQVEVLIGCSGAFDTVADILDQVPPGEKSRIRNPISKVQFYQVYNSLLSSTREERLKMKGMDIVRVDLIVPAVVMIEMLISELQLGQIIHTDYALREGVLFEHLYPIGLSD